MNCAFWWGSDGSLAPQMTAPLMQRLTHLMTTCVVQQSGQASLLVRRLREVQSLVGSHVSLLVPAVSVVSQSTPAKVMHELPWRMIFAGCPL